MDPVSATVSGGFGLLSGLLGGIGAQQANAQSAENARNMMEHQYFMSSTAHQREVQDLKAAGLNPILSVNAGASTTQGAMAPVMNEMEPAATALSSSGKEIANYMSEKMEKEVELLKSQKQKTDKETQVLSWDAKKSTTLEQIFDKISKFGQESAKKVEDVKKMSPEEREKFREGIKKQLNLGEDKMLPKYMDNRTWGKP